MAMVPGVPAIFVADQRYCPYGTMSDQLIHNRSRAICDWLTAQGATQIVEACNIATSVAIESLRAHCSVPVTGIEPAIKHSCRRHVRDHFRVFWFPCFLWCLSAEPPERQPQTICNRKCSGRTLFHWICGQAGQRHLLISSVSCIQTAFPAVFLCLFCGDETGRQPASPVAQDPTFGVSGSPRK